jgi:hypothetical protein
LADPVKRLAHTIARDAAADRIQLCNELVHVASNSARFELGINVSQAHILIVSAIAHSS